MMEEVKNKPDLTFTFSSRKSSQQRTITNTRNSSGELIFSSRDGWRRRSRRSNTSLSRKSRERKSGKGKSFTRPAPSSPKSMKPKTTQELSKEAAQLLLCTTRASKTRDARKSGATK
jgi:hypothetical protein